jgi:hypothetical protein
VDFVVCTLAVGEGEKKKKKKWAGFDMSDQTIPLLVLTRNSLVLWPKYSYYIVLKDPHSIFFPRSERTILDPKVIQTPKETLITGRAFYLYFGDLWLNLR